MSTTVPWSVYAARLISLNSAWTQIKVTRHLHALCFVKHATHLLHANVPIVKQLPVFEVATPAKKQPDVMTKNVAELPAKPDPVPDAQLQHVSAHEKLIKACQLGDCALKM